MDEAVNRQVGAAIRFQRETNLQITQEELANRTGLSRSSIANIEGGRQQLTVGQLMRFAGVFGVDPGELLPTIEIVGPLAPVGALLPSTTKASLMEWADKLFEDHA